MRSKSTQNVRSAIGFSNWTYAADDLKKYWHSTEKTIYDPCPKGYKVPDYDAFILSKKKSLFLSIILFLAKSDK